MCFASFSVILTVTVEQMTINYSFICEEYTNPIQEGPMWFSSGFWIRPRRKLTWHELPQVLQSKGSFLDVASLLHMHVHMHVGMIPSFVHRLYSSCSEATLWATRSGPCKKGYSNKDSCDDEEDYAT